MSQVNPSALVDVIARRLIEPDTRRIQRLQDAVIERAHSEAGTPVKSQVISITKPAPHILVHTQAVNSGATPKALPPLPGDEEEAAKMVTDFQKTLRDFKSMQQTLVQLLRGVLDGQTIRNTLPEPVYALVRDELPFERTAEEACTLEGRVRDLEQFQKIRPLMVSYAMAGLVLE